MLIAYLPTSCGHPRFRVAQLAHHPDAIRREFDVRHREQSVG